MDVTIDPRSGYLYARVSGEYVENMPVEGRPVSMARACRDGHYRCLLIDIRGLTGELGPGVYFHRGEEIAKAFAFNIIRIAIYFTVSNRTSTCFHSVPTYTSTVFVSYPSLLTWR